VSLVSGAILEASRSPQYSSRDWTRSRNHRAAALAPRQLQLLHVQQLSLQPVNDLAGPRISDDHPELAWLSLSLWICCRRTSSMSTSTIAASLRPPPGGVDDSLLIQGCLVQLGCLTSTVWLGSPKNWRFAQPRC
jgi:hypothetical protein